MGGIDQLRLGQMGDRPLSQMRTGVISGSQNESRCGAATLTYRYALPELCQASLHRSTAFHDDRQRLPMQYPKIRPSPSIDPSTHLSR